MKTCSEFVHELALKLIKPRLKIPYLRRDLRSNIEEVLGIDDQPTSTTCLSDKLCNT